MWLDAAADPARTVRRPCPRHHTTGQGWHYILEQHDHNQWLQCPDCLHQWWHRDSDRWPLAS
jgi:hypothetical protein